MPYHQNSAGHGGRRCETARKTEVKIHGHHQEGHQKECADGSQHSRPQELEIGSVQGDPLTWKSLEGEKVRITVYFYFVLLFPHTSLLMADANAMYHPSFIIYYSSTHYLFTYYFLINPLFSTLDG